MSQPLLTAFLSSLVEPPPHTKKKDVSNTILYFRFKGTFKGVRRQEAYSLAQKGTSTLSLSVPIATLQRFCDSSKGNGTMGQRGAVVPAT